MVATYLQDVTVNLYLLSPNARQFAWLVNCCGFIWFFQQLYEVGTMHPLFADEKTGFV